MNHLFTEFEAWNKRKGIFQDGLNFLENRSRAVVSIKINNKILTSLSNQLFDTSLRTCVPVSMFRNKR